LRPDDEGWIEPPCPTQPQLDFVDLTDGEAGLAIVNRGLPEYEVLDDADRTIALTLLRCYTHKTRSTQVDDPTQTGTQCPGKHEFHYAICPHAGDTMQGNVFAEAQRLNYPFKTVQGWKCGGGDPADGRLPARFSGLSIAPRELVMSSLKQSEDGNRLVLRFFNPSDREIEACIRVHRHIAHAVILDLEENVLQSCDVEEPRTIIVRTGAKQIVTLGITL
jgi:alpha-mannosidase